MVDTKLSALTAIAALDDDDLLLTTDTSATESKKITRANFVTDMAQATQTFTNKTFNADGTGNSITNIENADIKAAAAIAVNKLEALTVSELVLTDGSGFLASAAVATYPSLAEIAYVKGLTSSVQTQLNAKAPLVSPSFTTPSLGVATATSINGATITSGTLNGSVTGSNTGDITVVDSAEIDFTLTGQQITASLVAGSIDETKLDASTNASLDLADSATQPGDAITTLNGTAHRVFYSNGTGDVTELALGADGTFLKSNGATTAPSFAAPAGGGDALTTNPLSQFAATTSSQLAGVISDETGSGALVFATSPTLVTPALGTPSSGVLTNCTGTASGLTAGTVTTNANLTGVVTSTGNATAIADAALSIAKTSGLQAELDLKPDSDPTGVTGADAVTNMMSLTQAEYDAITPNASTFYIITDA